MALQLGLGNEFRIERFDFSKTNELLVSWRPSFEIELMVSDDHNSFTKINQLITPVQSKWLGTWGWSSYRNDLIKETIEK